MLKNAKRNLRALALAALCVCPLGLGGCEAGLSGPSDSSAVQSGPEGPEGAVRFDRSLDGYGPRKTEYDFYFTYKMVHPWWDAVALGMEDAARQYEEMGVSVNYEYLAPVSVSAQDQLRRLREAAGRGFDVIGVDVADVGTVTPSINALLDEGHKVMTFSSSDASKENGCGASPTWATPTTTRTGPT